MVLTSNGTLDSRYEQSAAKRISGGMGIAGSIDWPQDRSCGRTEMEGWRLDLLRSMLCCRRGRSGGWPSVKWIVVVWSPVVGLRATASVSL